MIRIVTLTALFSAGLSSVINLNPRCLQALSYNVELQSKEIDATNFEQGVPASKEIHLKLARFKTRDLSNDFSDFLSLIDVKAIVSVVFEYLEDPEVLNLIEFVSSPEFKDTVAEFEAMSEFKEAFTYLTSKGYDLTPVLNLIHDILSLPPYPAARIVKNGISGLIESVIEVLPIEDLRALFREKMITSPEFADLYETLTSDEFKNILERMSINENFIKVKQRLEDLGFDFEYIEKVLKEMLQTD